MSKAALIEAAKELFRVLLFGAIGWAVAYFTALPETQTTAIILIVLRIADKYIHDDSTGIFKNVKGISPI